MNKKILVLMLAFSLMLSGCAKPNQATDNQPSSDQSSKSDNTQPLKVEYQIMNMNELLVLLDVAEAKNFFKENNVAIKLIPVEKNTEQILLSGQADISLSGLPGPLTLYLNGENVKWLGALTRPSGMVASRFPKERTKEVTSAVVTRFGGMPQLLVDLTLKKLGANPDKTKFIAMSDEPGRVALLKQGKVDFIRLESPLSIKNYDFSNGFYTYDTVNELTQMIITKGIFTMGKTFEQKNGQIKNFVKAIYQTINYVKENPTDAETIVQNKEKIDNAKAKELVNIFIKQIKDVPFVPDTEALKPDLPYLIKEYKPTDASRPLNDFVATDFTRQAIK